MTTPAELRDLIKQELPKLVQEDREIHELILRLSRQEFAPKQLTEDRIERMLAQLERGREEQAQKWVEDKRRWEANVKKWEENDQRWESFSREQAEKWEEDKRRWEANVKKWEENDQRWESFSREQAEKWEEDKRRWEANVKKWKENDQRWESFSREQAEKWEENNRRWEENQAELRLMREKSEQKWEEHRREFDRVHEEIMALAQKQERTVGALGARWGISSEKAFRDALASVLERNFDVRVMNVNEYDEQGMVFGRPDQVELDVIVTNGTLILMELKSSIDKAGMYIFERKARFYEQRHNRKANRLIVISPMIEPRARAVGERLGIEMFGDSIMVESI
jgi:hypothetical protein